MSDAQLVKGFDPVLINELYAKMHADLHFIQRGLELFNLKPSVENASFLLEYLGKYNRRFYEYKSFFPKEFEIAHSMQISKQSS